MIISVLGHSWLLNHSIIIEHIHSGMDLALLETRLIIVILLTNNYFKRWDQNTLTLILTRYIKLKVDKSGLQVEKVVAKSVAAFTSVHQWRQSSNHGCRRTTTNQSAELRLVYIQIEAGHLIRSNNRHHCACPPGPFTAEYFIRFCFCLWLQNQTRTTFFLRSSFSAMAAIFSPDGLGCKLKYASSERFSGAAIEVRLRFLSSEGKTQISNVVSRVILFFRAWASAASSQACRMGFSATMLLWDKVSDSKL